MLSHLRTFYCSLAYVHPTPTLTPLTFCILSIHPVYYCSLTYFDSRTFTAHRTSHKPHLCISSVFTARSFACAKRNPTDYTRAPLLPCSASVCTYLSSCLSRTLYTRRCLIPCLPSLVTAHIMLRGESAGSTRRNDMSRLLRYQSKAVSVRACDQEIGRVNRWRGVRVRRLDSCRAVRVSWAVIRNSAPVRLPSKWQISLHLRRSGEAAIHGVWQLDKHTDAKWNRSWS